MKTKSNLSYKVTENNGGGISLWVFDDGNGNQFAHTSYEYHPDSLLEDIKALYKADNSVTDWDGNSLLDEDMVRRLKITTDEETGQELYPSDDDIYDADGGIIPIDIDDLYDDDDTTLLIAEGNKNSLTIYPHGLGTAGTECFDPLLIPYKDADDGYIGQEEITFKLKEISN